MTLLELPPNVVFPLSSEERSRNFCKTSAMLGEWGDIVRKTANKVLIFLISPRKQLESRALTQNVRSL